MAARASPGVLLCALLAAAAGRADWPQWRGPARDGVARSFQAPATWPKALKLQWKTPVGSGHSSPVVAGSRVFVHSRREEQEIVQALDMATGKELWFDRYAAPFNKNKYALSHPKGPFSTPLVDGANLFTMGVTAILTSYEAAMGRVKWRKDFSARVDTSRLFTGTAMSPVLEAGMLIVHVGDDRGGEILALDPATGAQKWAWKGDGPGYASPIVVELEGTRQVVTLTDRSAVGIAAATGALLWRLPFADEWNENIVTPVLFDKTLVFSGVRKPTMAVRVIRKGQQWTAEPLWQSPDLSMYISSPVLDGGLLYGFSSKRKGQFFCLDARTGKTLWTSAGRAADHAAVTIAGPWLLALTSSGELIVAPTSPKGFQPSARYTVSDNATWSHPVFTGRQILVKDAAALSSWSVE